MGGPPEPPPEFSGPGLSGFVGFVGPPGPRTPLRPGPARPSRHLRGGGGISGERERGEEIGGREGGRESLVARYRRARTWPGVRPSRSRNPTRFASLLSLLCF